MEPSNITTQSSEPRYPTRAKTSRTLFYDFGTPNSTQHQVPSPDPKHVQGTQFPSHSTPMEKAPEETSVVGSEEIDFGIREQVKQKRYRKRNFKKTSSIYRGVTKCKGRFESFVWDKDLKTTGKRGKTGGFKNELEAARAHDLIAIKIWGKFAYTNFPMTFYLKEISEMEKWSLREYILELRRQSKDPSTTVTDGSNVSSSEGGGASAEVEENNVVGDALSNPESTTTMPPMLDESGQQSEAPTALENGDENNAEENKILCDDEYPWSDVDLSFPLWPCAFGDAPVEEHANALGSALNRESSMSSENPAGAENGSVASFGSGSPNVQQFEAFVHRYEPLQHELDNNTHSEDEEDMVVDNDFDISEYLNLDDMDD
ncbi:unnamed protein product [Sphenostylis stenocarpa]|uniref:AP2/ERF domain-containing protein n=1 Tax=Sphenostylis stenocarpa TaxID=92480 RepID=A0AA86VIB4_9FABA|nr:unnamed protein product [Sphenostylis stenocarpa]